VGSLCAGFTHLSTEQPPANIIIIITARARAIYYLRNELMSYPAFICLIIYYLLNYLSVYYLFIYLSVTLIVSRLTHTQTVTGGFGWNFQRRLDLA